VPSLLDVQRAILRALVAGDSTSIVPVLAGGNDAARRLAVHHRHYHASLVRVLTDRFPATVWLVGSPFLTDAARAFVDVHPPAGPCLAEYGADFPGFLATRPAATDTPYLADFASLEWHVGQAAVEVAHQPVTLDALANLTPDALADTCLTLQPGVRHLPVSWNVDDLMTMYLTESEAEQFSLARCDGGIEVRGARGDVHVTRLASGDFAFRCALVEGCSLADAAERAAGVDEGFEPGRALVSLASAGLIATFRPTSERSAR
jgi:hypothetical protein